MRCEITSQAGIEVQQMKPSTTDAVAQLITKDYGNLIIRNKEAVEIARRAFGAHRRKI